MITEMISCLQQLVAALAPPQSTPVVPQTKSLKERFDEALSCIKNGATWLPDKEVLEHNDYSVLRHAARAGNVQFLKDIHEAIGITPEMARAKGVGGDNMLLQALIHKHFDVVKFLFETVKLGVDDLCPDLLFNAAKDFEVLVYVLTKLDLPEESVKFVLEQTPSVTRLVMHLARPNGA